jgi:cell division protein FtsI/penicillin-binding protein 2
VTRSQIRRTWLVLAGLAFLTMVIVGRLFAFQIVQGDEWRGIEQEQVVAEPERGVIYDRNGAVLAANGADYQVAVAPNLVIRPEEVAQALAPILEENRQYLLSQIQSDKVHVVLKSRVSTEVANAIREIPYFDDGGIFVTPMFRRIYPQGSLLSHVLGYVDFDGGGGSGLERYYQSELAGISAAADVNLSPLEPQVSVLARNGADMVLTIDRSVQQLVEEHLAQGLAQYGAPSGSIIVMDPRTGDILAMAALPDFEPYSYFDYAQNEVTTRYLANPVVSAPFEPGSIMKLITMAAALDSGTVTPATTYNDIGVMEHGGLVVYNWDRGAHGTTDMTNLLAKSLNVGAATIAVWMGQTEYYNYLLRFNFGHQTGIDLSAEAPGYLPLPGGPEYTDANLAANSFGQAFTATPLQMITSISALANNGTMMQPRLVREIHYPEREPVLYPPKILSQPIRPETAQQLTNMAINAVQREVYDAHVEGYTVAGKTGTAQIAEGNLGYHPSDVIGAFIGWLPADDPEVIILVKVDRPQYEQWGSTTAAPIFAELVQDLVVLLDIPPDNVRLDTEIWRARQQNE